MHKCLLGLFDHSRNCSRIWLQTPKSQDRDGKERQRIEVAYFSGDVILLVPSGAGLRRIHGRSGARNLHNRNSTRIDLISWTFAARQIQVGIGFTF